MERTGAKELILTHYSSLGFGSKMQGWWENEFPKEFLRWCIMLGIRHTQSDLEAILDVKNCLVEDYPIHNENSLKLAFKLNMKGTLGEPIEPFGQINRVFITKVMERYEKKLKEDHKRAIEIRNKLTAPVEVEMSQAEKDKAMQKAMDDCYRQYVDELRNDIDLISSVMYDFLERKGVKVVEDDVKNDLMVQAEAYLVMIERMADGKIQKTSLENWLPNPNDVVSVAKRLAVRDYWNKLILNG